MRARLVLLAAVPLVVAGGILAAILLAGFRTSAHEQLERHGVLLASIVAAESGDALAGDDVGGRLAAMVERLAGRDGVTHVAVLDRQGRVVAHSSPGEVGTLAGDEPSRRALGATAPEATRQRIAGRDTLEVAVPITAALLPGHVARGGAAAERLGVVRVGLSLEPVGAALRRQLGVALGALALLLGACLLASSVVARRVAAPLERMTWAAVRMADGDLRERVTAGRADEVGVLAGAFGRMAASLAGTIREIQRTASRIATTGEEMLASARRVKDGAADQSSAANRTAAMIQEMNATVARVADGLDGLSGSAETAASAVAEMSAAIAQVADGTNVLSTSVDDTASALLEMSASIKQLVGHGDGLVARAREVTTSIAGMQESIAAVGARAKESAALTERASRDAAEIGRAAVERTMAGMERIREAVDRTSVAIDKLSGRAEQIGRILTVIEEVTDQTSLLALNAAILAAQAG
ncbi:MAG TPA: HAMP domain-containing protein, partial [Thermodesulfobacteriota bacterium]